MSKSFQREIQRNESQAERPRNHPPDNGHGGIGDDTDDDYDDIDNDDIDDDDIDDDDIDDGGIV